MKLLICTQVVDKNHPILGFFHGWILEFARHFDEVHVICLEKGEYELPGHVQVYSLGKERGAGKLRQLFTFYQIFSRLFFTVNVDYVFYHMGAIYNVLGAPYFWLRKLYGTKFYWWKAHGHINSFGRFALRFVNRVYTSTETGFPIVHPKRQIIGQAVDFTLCNPDGRINTKTIIYVGRISPIKQLEVFIETAKQLGFETCQFKIIGPFVDDVYEKHIRELCADTPIEICGPQTPEQLIRIYQQSYVFLNTSMTHSMDKTILESIGCGCIPVTANHAFRDMLSPYSLYAAESDAESFAQIIQTIDNQDISRAMDKLRSQVVRDHSLETLTNRIFKHD